MQRLPSGLNPTYVAIAAALLSLGSAHAISPTLANSPINQQNLVQPNILFMMDRSGSMDSEYVPDEANAPLNGKVGYTNYQCNKLAYNPNTVYSPPIDSVGANLTTAAANSISAAYTNGFATTPSNSTTNLTGNFYYNYTGSGAAPTVYSDSRCKEAANNVASSTNFTRVNVNTLNATQQLNYANWYSYYRSRFLMMKTAVGKGFRNLNSDIRFGFMTIDTQQGNIGSTANSSYIPMATMDSTQRSTFYSTYYALGTQNSTPLLAALSGAGLYYAGKYSYDPVLPSGPTNGGECQRNYTILSTDGYWNSEAKNPIGCSGCSADLTWARPSTSGTNVPDMDNNSGSPFSTQSSGRYATGASGTLADVALYYYMADLRPSYRKLDPNRDTTACQALFTNSNGAPPLPAATAAAPTACKPPFIYRNMTTYTVGVGVAGNLNYVDDYETNSNSAVNDFVNIKSGSKTWPAPTANTITTADDLWHAAVNGGGTFFSAGDADKMAQGLSRTLANITSQTVYNVAPVSSSPVLTSDNNISYKSNYRSGSWTGRLNAVLLDPNTGDEATVPLSNPPVLAAPIWRAHLKLDRQATAYDPSITPATLPGTGWSTNRKIFIGKGSAGTATPFIWGNLSSTQQAALQDGVNNAKLTAMSISKPYGQLVLEYLRGSEEYEENVAGVRQNNSVAQQFFRGRGDDTSGGTNGDLTQGILGDIVNSKPFVVGDPKEAYTDAFNPGYSTFKTAKTGRTPMVYAGANDGMVHAFNAEFAAGTGSTKIATANSGREEWAYIPSMLVHANNDENGYKSGLQSYSYPIGGNPSLGIPPAQKHAFVDGILQVNDVDLERTAANRDGTGVVPANTATQDWRSLLIGALGKGGKGYFALDVTQGTTTTTGTALTETLAAGKLLWEFTGFPTGSQTSDPDLGYSFGNAVISRSEGYGWIVAVTSGYNNTSGNGAVWVLNAKTGALIQKFAINGTTSTSSCSGATCQENGVTATNPLNLSKIVGYVYSVGSEQLLAIYGGDMQGNVWRMDVSDHDKANWTIRKLAKLTAPTTVAAGATSKSMYDTSVTPNTTNYWQPVTTAPTVAWDSEKDRRWVFVGTGMDLSADDRKASKAQANQTQTMYALIDGTGAASRAATANPLTRDDLVAVDPESTTAVAMGANQSGWRMDLKIPVNLSLAERVVLQPIARFGAVVFSTSTPVTDVCSPGYSGTTYARGYLEGQLGASFLLDGNGIATKYITTASGYAANPSLQIINGQVSVRVSNLQGETKGIPWLPQGLNKRARISWRELLNE